MPLRICILQADDLHPDLESQYHSFGQMFERLLAQQALPVRCEVYNVVAQQYPDDSSQYDAFLVTGSKADSFAMDAWIVRLREYLQQRYQQGDVLLGVCFGHQILALVLGGLTERASQGWGVGVHCYQVLNAPVAGLDVPQQLQLLISHRDQVTRLPEQAVRIASSEFCPNAAYVVGEQVLCFQGHPEFTHDFSRALLNLRRSIYSPEFYAQCLASLEQQHDGRVVAGWMAEFVAQARRNKLRQTRSGLCQQSGDCASP
ncbi:amidotransferase [Thiopseudomonas acetoxidans]|uniref:Amidotransferase n=1 Tax=Thiopseudomonas acetoxidans TaxID=3041622 RepID=A0ABT7SR82_9GAMM|nr:amidotransferase [Thiopseudomonas sp. CY1220]MDM7858703.1 amidotransferase [Thiopseudomonas sp. CY1220]